MYFYGHWCSGSGEPHNPWKLMISLYTARQCIVKSRDIVYDIMLDNELFISV